MKRLILLAAALATCGVFAGSARADGASAFMCTPAQSVIPQAISVLNVKAALAGGSHYAFSVIGDKTVGLQLNNKGTGSLRCNVPPNAQVIPGVLTDNNGWAYPAVLADFQTIGYPLYIVSS